MFFSPTQENPEERKRELRVLEAEEDVGAFGDGVSLREISEAAWKAFLARLNTVR
jgi:hypothetical protein